MGRKKRKAVEIEPAAEDASKTAIVPDEPAKKAEAPPAVVEQDKTTPKASSNYALTTHSAEIFGEDVYVSDGSEDEEDEGAMLILSGSRLGLMRTGPGRGHNAALMQQDRVWNRKDAETTEIEEEKLQEELAALDPVERAARLRVQKERLQEKKKELERQIESEENAGRDPCLFSKRTAFDIRMDQIEDKPWEHGGDLTDFFNYNMTEADWLDYSQRQLLIRQELTEASKQRRAPDPTIVTVSQRAPHKQTPKVAVASSTNKGDGTGEGDDAAHGADGEVGPVIGPVRGKKDDKMDVDEATEGKKEEDIKDVGMGGAWGAGVAPGSTLARLIEEQERKESDGASAAAASSSEQNPSERGGDEDRYSDRHEHNHYLDRHDHDDDASQRSDWKDRNDYSGGYQSSPQYARRGGHFPPPHSGPPPPYYGRGRGYRPPYPPNHNAPPPPWAGRGRRGGGDFRGRYSDGYGGGYRR